ncbi:hypothetical protein SLS60_009621 [Paraconiothyrium brasiliense]|uniref:Uncharacterized protein n=1 Tax=Paraconiothyrium brasiliense TaxID=300254 RepID=A0ABR3QUT3_9PLEO
MIPRPPIPDRDPNHRIPSLVPSPLNPNKPKQSNQPPPVSDRDPNHRIPSLAPSPLKPSKPAQSNQPPPIPDRDPNHRIPSLVPSALNPNKPRQSNLPPPANPSPENSPPAEDPTDYQDQIEAEAMAKFFNDVYFSDIADGLLCGDNPPAEYRQYAVGGGCYYVPHVNKGPSQTPNGALDSPDQAVDGSAQPTITAAPGAKPTGNGTIDPWAIKPQADEYLTDELVPPSGLAPTYYAEVESETAWLWTFFTPVPSQLTTSMNNGAVLESEEDEDLAVLVWATPNATEATTTSSMIESINTAGELESFPAITAP